MTPTKMIRPKRTQGTTEKVKCGCGNLYITVNHNIDNGRLVEVFATLGKAGGCAMAQNEAITRLISLALRCDVDKNEIVEQLKGIRCPSISLNEDAQILSCADAIAQVLDKAEVGNAQA